MRYRLDGKVVPKMRPRFDPRTKRAYHEPRYSSYLEGVAWELAAQHSGPVINGPVALGVDFAEGSTFITVKELEESRRPQRGDIDNMVGSVMDAMNGVVFKDDTLVEALSVTFGARREI